MTDELFAKGVAIRDEMLGPEHGSAKLANQTDWTRDFEDLVTRYCFASVWGREELPRDIRSMLTIAMLANAIVLLKRGFRAARLPSTSADDRLPASCARPERRSGRRRR